MFENFYQLYNKLEKRITHNIEYIKDIIAGSNI